VGCTVKINFFDRVEIKNPHESAGRRGHVVQITRSAMYGHVWFFIKLDDSVRLAECRPYEVRKLSILELIAEAAQ